MHIETSLAQLGSKKDKVTGSINQPVYLATAYEHVDGQSTGYDYTRTANPTRDALEEAIAHLELGDRGYACSSGMAAIHTLMGLFSQGDHLIVSLDLYGGTYRLFEQIINRSGITFTYVDMRNVEEINEAIQPQTKAIFVETPTNPLMRVTDITQVSNLAKKHQLLTIVDNTFCTPYLQKPLRLGADIVIHSATKYLGGHNDVLAGLIVTKGAEISERVSFLHNTIGATLPPLDAYLLMRGMKTLALRMEKHQENAERLISYLQQHRCIGTVFYPSLLEKDREVQKKQALGHGGMLSFQLKRAEWVQPFLLNLRLITFAESLGGVESLITYPATQTHADIPEEIRKQVGVCDRLLRLSVGIENSNDLIADIDQALQLVEISHERSEQHVF